MKTEEHASPWAPVISGIVGLVIGYTLVLAQTDQLHFARANHCPSRDISRNAA